LPERRIKMATKGMDRIFISVSNLEDSLAFYRDWTGMKVVAEETLEPAEIQQLWKLPRDTKARAVSLKSELQPTLLELIKFNPNSGRIIREGTNSLDYGIYCITFLVKDIDKVYHDLTKKGFTFVSPPIEFQPTWAPIRVKFATLIGPDNVPIGHYEIMNAEEHKSPGNYVRLDHCAQYVDNMKETIEFYRDILDLDLSGEFTLAKGLLDDILGLPPGTEVKLAFIAKKDENALLMELDEFSAKGKSLAPVARPPNLGLFTMSFEVDNLASLMETFKKEGIAILSGPVELHTKLHGKMRAITVEGANGELIELFER